MTSSLRAAHVLAASDGPVEIFGVALVGISVTVGLKVLFTLALVAAVWFVHAGVLRIVRRIPSSGPADPHRFWARQVVQLVTAVVLALGTLSIWITPDTDISTGIGLISAGLAFALQQVITALAAYFVILRGDTFGVGDRITLGGVRGDVIRLGFLKTTIMEMGQPPAVQNADPAVWVHSRQYTGRIVTVTNGVIFTEPVYNYSREFPYIWEELALPIGFDADLPAVERILLDAAAAHAVVDLTEAEHALERMRSRFAIAHSSVRPTVFWRITDNWVELSLRFLVPQRGVREIKDAMSRDILAGLKAAGVGIASATYDIVGLPPVRVEDARAKDPD